MIVFALLLATAHETYVQQKADSAELQAQYEQVQAENANLNVKLRNVGDAFDNLLIQHEEEVKKLRNYIEKLESIKAVSVEATYYTAFCNTGCTGITATGIDVRSTIRNDKGLRVIAVDPAVIPLGTVVNVKTPYNTFKAVAGDTGGDINGRRIDILVASKTEARDKGRVQAVVTW